MQKKNGVFTRGLTLQGLLFLAALTLFCILSSCHFYNLPLEDFLKEWTETARIAESSISPEPVYKDSYAHIASGEDTLITYKLINPQNYDLEIEVTFDPSPLGWDPIRTDNYPGFSGPSNQGTVEQDATDKSIIRLTLNKNALASLDGTGTEISPTVSIMEPKSGRNFGSYRIPLRVNTAPPAVSSPIILYNNTDNTYVICFNMPDMNTTNYSIHRDIVSLTVSGFYGKTYTVTAPADSSGNGLTGVTSTYDDTNYTEVTGGGAFVGDKTNRFVGIETGVSLTAVPSPECTITLTDSSGLTSVATASTEAPPLPAVTASPGSGTIEPGVPVTFNQETANSTVTLTLDSTEGVSVSGGSFTGNTVTFTGGSSGISLTFVKKGTYTVTATAGGISGARDTTTTFTYTVPYSAVYVADSGDDISGNGTESAPFATLDKAMVTIGGEGVVYVTGTVSVSEHNHSSGNLTLRGYGSGGTLINSSGRVLNITGGSVTLGNGITLTGDINISGNQYGGAVYVGGGAFFTMESGSTIADSSVISSSGSDALGGGVAVMDGGTFTMNDGAYIIRCHANNGGGGVYVYDSNFTMNGGVIGGRSDNSNVAKWGGGVFVGSGCVVTMNRNSEISYNSAEDTGSTATGIEGGGVHFSAITESTFTMNDNAKIIHNTCDGQGGGVYVGNSDSLFFMNDNAQIKFNQAASSGTYNGGGGVYFTGDGTFTVSGSPDITDNTLVDSSTNNVTLTSGKTITIGAGGLTGGTIGVTAESITGTSGGAVQITDVKVENAERIFSSDVEGACIVIDNSAVFLSKTIVPETLKVEGGSCTLNDKEVTLSNFWISPYEVTQAEFENVMTGNTNDIESNPSYFQGEENLPANGEVQAKRPVDNVSWYDAIVYCNLLSIKEGLTPCYTIKGSENPAD